MITEDYVSFEVAKLLREKGFDENTEHKMWYVIKQFSTGCQWNSCTHKVGDITREYNNDCCISMPTHQMAMKWLRNIHGIHIQVLCPVVDIDTNILGVKYNVVISNLKDYCLAFMTDIEDNDYDSYEEAVDAGLKYTLEHLL